jgi:hypothetical protein
MPIIPSSRRIADSSGWAAVRFYFLALRSWLVSAALVVIAGHNITAIVGRNLSLKAAAQLCSIVLPFCVRITLI